MLVSSPYLDKRLAPRCRLAATWLCTVQPRVWLFAS